jgi:ABC-type nitrate/sulfonate/bicarbonate transport system substrate-binding protein
MKKPCGLVAVMLVAAFACITSAHAREKVRVAYAVQIHQANMMLLRDYGQKHGVDIELTPMRHYTNLQLALTTNQVDVAAMGYVNIGLMEELGFRNYKVIAGVFTGAQSLTLRNRVTANTWKDLEGKSIGVAPNSYADILFRSSAKLGGADLTKIKFVSFGPGGPQVIAALRNGDIDGFVFWEPNNAEAALSKAGYYSSLDLGKNPTRHINGMMAVNADFAASKKDAVVGVVKSLVEATDALMSDPARYAQVAQRGTGAAAEVVQESLPHGAMDYRLYQKEAKALLRMIHEAGVTKTDTSAAVDRAFDYGFLMEATGKSKTELGGE